MKTNPLRQILSLSLPALALVAVVGCAGPAKLTANDRIIGAEGEVATKQGDNGNTQINLKVNHLAKPEIYRPGAKTYVVWVKGENNPTPQNVGALKINDKLEGEIQTITPMPHFQIFITAENDQAVPAPTGDRVMWTQNL